MKVSKPGAVYPEFVLPYGPKRVCDFVPSGISLTKQSFRDECDINLIMKRFAETGVVDPGLVRQGHFVDVAAVDFHQAMVLVSEARTAFESLPAAVRDRFGNDPHELLAFLEDEKNRDEAVKLGLVEPAKPAPGEQTSPEGASGVKVDPKEAGKAAEPAKGS